MLYLPNAAANSSGSTVNQQVNNQINQSSSCGLGAGINCSLPTVGLPLFGSSGTGKTNGSESLWRSKRSEPWSRSQLYLRSLPLQQPPQKDNYLFL
ncbi:MULTISPECIES: hypothetical protein [Pseudanabaena]|uniref:hypothetical protein n=1 Tax=Pseudanabaena TaxID=1152 RepID=UPI00247AD0BF|nr:MULTISPECIES: hypothetical protein [Pseudanabaena]MEA5488196.1 hypothetical protein [Pseudanabaena sp. CCNP1317]WGS74761.1 hypothetical protein OA858_23485 [Pseudanabaena galeata CCNP1313]